MRHLRTEKLTEKEKENAKKIILVMEADRAPSAVFKDEKGRTLYLVEPGTAAERVRKDLENESQGRPKTRKATKTLPTTKGIPVFIDSVEGYLVANQ
jgi:hypothetical protein